MKRLIFLVLVLVLLSSTAVFATQSFSVTTESVNSRIFSDESAEYRMTIRNLDVADDRFIIYSEDPTWLVYAESSVITVGAKETRSIRLILEPTRSVLQARVHEIPLIIASTKTNMQARHRVSVTIESDAGRTYSPNIFISTDIGEGEAVTLNKPLEINMLFLNRNPLDIADLEVQIKSELFSDILNFPLGPNQQENKLLRFDISPHTVPGTKYYYVTLHIDGQQIGSVREFNYEVAEYAPDFLRRVTINEERFLESEYEVEILNRGNVVQTEEFLYKLSKWQSLFTDTSEVDTYKQVDGSRFAVFIVPLAPGESQTIYVKTSFRLFALVLTILILIALGSFIAYYGLRAPILVSKRVQIIHKDADGVSELKVILDVKNRTSKLLKNVRVLERAPTITEVIDESIVGTMAPTKIVKNAVKGTLVRWDFPTIEPYEERLLTYKIKSKLSILGDIKLPTAMVKYESFGHTRTFKETEPKDDPDEN